MDPSAPWTLLYGTLATSTISAVTVGIIGATAGKPAPTLAATFAAFNSGVTAATFFGIREFAVSPLLVYYAPWPQYAQRRRDFGITPKKDDHELQGDAFQAMRTDKLLDSGISGALAGGLIRGIKSGPKSIVSGSLLGSAICLGVQYGFNYAAVARLRYINRQSDPSSAAAPEEEPERLDMRLGRRFVKLFGVEMVSDEEVVVRMKRTRDRYMERIKELEQQLEDERSSKDNSDDGQSNSNP